MRDLLGGLFELLAPTRCAGCDELSTHAVFCPRCEALVNPVESPGAVFEYGGPVASAIQHFKYGGRSDLAKALGAPMACEAQRWAGRLDAVVPVPLHWRRRRERGYDHAALLAKAVARSLGVPVFLRGLRRTRNTPRQVDLPHGARQRNMAGAFSPWRLHGVTRVLLVDDVRTTGATLHAASAALAAGKVVEVHPLVLATRVL